MIRLILGSLVLALAAVSPGICVAQANEEQHPNPLEVTVAPSEGHIVKNNATVTVPKVSIDIRNVSAKCVVAISLRLQYLDPDGKNLGTGGLSTFRHNKEGQFDCLQPGEVFHLPHTAGNVPLDQSGDPAKTEVVVDFVIFGDGSTWGPGTRGEEKGRLLGKFEAYKARQSQ
jgi:hypothetical protein